MQRGTHKPDQTAQSEQQKYAYAGISAASFAANCLCRGSSQRETAGARGALKSCGCSSGQVYTPGKDAVHTLKSSGACLGAHACVTLYWRCLCPGRQIPQLQKELAWCKWAQEGLHLVVSSDLTAEPASCRRLDWRPPGVPSSLNCPVGHLIPAGNTG